MGSKAEFGQKLLDDLRMRKQRMATSQSSSNAEKYRDFKHPYRESREIGSRRQDVRPNTGHSSSSRSLNRVETSKELVPVGRARSSEPVADWSVALAFALRKGGEFRKDNSGSTMAGYLNYLGGRSVDFREIDRKFHLEKNRPSNGRTPTLSPLHVKEIAKGAQKLNQILRACYNGINFDVYSTDLGKELLKGARDLEESLKLLVDLQEASEYMVVPRKQQKLRLLEVDGDEEDIDEVNKLKQLDKPRFASDRNSRKQQKLLAITYHRETPQLSSGKQTPSTSKLISHRRSASCGPDSSTTTSLSFPKVSQPERGRIPNIIAKLMGLEELPPKESNVGAQKEMHVKQAARTDFKKILQGSSKKEEQLSVEKPAQRKTTRKMRHAETQSIAPETSLVVYVDKISSTSSHFETEAGEPKPHSKERKHKEDTDLKSDSKKSTIKISKPDISMVQQHSNTESLVDNSEAKTRQEKLTAEKQMYKGRGDVYKVAPPTHKPSRKAMQERTETKNGILHKEKRGTNSRLLMVEKPPRQFQLTNVLKKSNYQDAKLQENERDLKAKTLLQMKKTKASQMGLKHSSISHINASKNASTEASDAMPSKRCSQFGDLSKRKNVTDIKPNIREAPNENPAEQRPFTRNPKTDFQNIVATLKPAVMRKSMQVLVAEKVANAEVQNGINSKAIEEVMIRDNKFPLNIAMSMKEQPSIAVEPKQSTHCSTSSIEADVSVNGHTEAKLSVQRLNSSQELQNDVACASISSMVMGKNQTLNELEPYFRNVAIQDSNTKGSHSLELSTISPSSDQALSSSTIIPIKGFHEDEAVRVSRSFQQDPLKILKPKIPEQLTENEKSLKRILCTSQLFLNAAEALFGLQIPIGILNSSVDKYQDDDNKLALDCGFEVMKRKGRRQEFTFHPSASISISTRKIRCLDDLVKDLHNDLEMLECHTKHETELDIANSLHEMLHKDIQKSKPDVNCMWDLGWDDAMFAYLEKEDVVKDVEKHVLNGLLDEFVSDIVHLSTVI